MKVQWGSDKAHAENAIVTSDCLQAKARSFMMGSGGQCIPSIQSNVN